MNVAVVLLPMWSTLAPPLGINYVGTCLREAGHNVKIWDYNVLMRKAYEQSSPDKTNWWEGAFALDWENEYPFENKIYPDIEEVYLEYREKLVKELKENNIQVIGLSVFSSCLEFSKMMAKYLNQELPDLKIVFGGPTMVRGCCIPLLKEGIIHGIIQNEGEVTMTELVNSWQRGESGEAVTGAQVFLKKGVVNPFVRRPQINMEDLPILNFDDFDFQNYLAPGLIPIMMSRGCVAKCTFCDEPSYWGKFRWRSPDHIFKEMEQNLEKYQINYFQSMDSLLNGHQRNFKKLAELLKDAQLSLPVHFGGNVRVSKHMDEEFFKILGEAGCTFLTFGLESGSQKILDIMRKNIKLEWAVDNFKHCHKYGIEVHVNIIVGFPGESEEDFDMTISFLKTVMQYISTLNIGVGMSIGPGQDVFINPEKYDILLNADGLAVCDEFGNWQSRDGSNNIETRRVRINKLRDFLSNYDVTINPQL